MGAKSFGRKTGIAGDPARNLSQAGSRAVGGRRGFPACQPTCKILIDNVPTEDLKPCLHRKEFARLTKSKETKSLPKMGEIRDTYLLNDYNSIFSEILSAALSSVSR